MMQKVKADELSAVVTLLELPGRSHIGDHAGSPEYRC